jgi:hypothetical protein
MCHKFATRCFRVIAFGADLSRWNYESAWTWDIFWLSALDEMLNRP